MTDVTISTGSDKKKFSFKVLVIITLISIVIFLSIFALYKFYKQIMKSLETAGKKVVDTAEDVGKKVVDTGEYIGEGSVRILKDGTKIAKDSTNQIRNLDEFIERISKKLPQEVTGLGGGEIVNQVESLVKPVTELVAGTGTGQESEQNQEQESEQNQEQESEQDQEQDQEQESEQDPEDQDIIVTSSPLYSSLGGSDPWNPGVSPSTSGWIWDTGTNSYRYDITILDNDNSCSSQGYIEYVNEQASIYGGYPQITINCNAINEICNNCSGEDEQPTVEACINSFNPTTSSSIQYTSETGIPANQGSAFEICKNVILENSS